MDEREFETLATHALQRIERALDESGIDADFALKEIPEAPRTVPPGIVSVPVMGVLGEGRLAPEFFYREAVPPPEVLQPIAPPLEIPAVGPPDTGPPA